MNFIVVYSVIDELFADWFNTVLLFVVCQPALVDSISVAQRLRGCTVIQGALEIQIRGGSKLFMCLGI